MRGGAKGCVHARPRRAGAKHVIGGLAEVLNELGAELRRANQTGKSTLLFGGADVELEVAAEASAGGVKFWVVNAGASGSYTRTARITVHLCSGEQEFGVGK